MKYLHLIGDKKQMLESFARKYDLQLQDKFVEDFAVLRSACQDMVRPLIQASEDEAVLAEAHALVTELGALFQELSVEYEQHVDRVQHLKESIQNSLW
jgi:hypothetical protein